MTTQFAGAVRLVLAASYACACAASAAQLPEMEVGSKIVKIRPAPTTGDDAGDAAAGPSTPDDDALPIEPETGFETGTQA
jgi:hypothetical protein